MLHKIQFQTLVLNRYKDIYKLFLSLNGNAQASRALADDCFQGLYAQLSGIPDGIALSCSGGSCQRLPDVQSEQLMPHLFRQIALRASKQKNLSSFPSTDFEELALEQQWLALRSISLPDLLYLLFSENDISYKDLSFSFEDEPLKSQNKLLAARLRFGAKLLEQDDSLAFSEDEIQTLLRSLDEPNPSCDPLLLQAYIDQKLYSMEAKNLEDHVSGCERCQKNKEIIEHSTQHLTSLWKGYQPELPNFAGGQALKRYQQGWMKDYQQKRQDYQPPTLLTLLFGMLVVGLVVFTPNPFSNTFGVYPKGYSPYQETEKAMKTQKRFGLKASALQIMYSYRLPPNTNFRRKSKRRFSARFSRPKPAYSGLRMFTGDRLLFLCNTHRKQYVAVASVDQKGKVDILFPRVGRRASKVGSFQLDFQKIIGKRDRTNSFRIVFVMKAKRFYLATLRRSLRKLWKKQGRSLEGMKHLASSWTGLSLLIHQKKMPIYYKEVMLGQNPPFR